MSKIVPISFHAVFQFHYGTIKSCIKQAIQGNGFAYFNSTMVRLKEENANELTESQFKFQFHYGTIKRVLTTSLIFTFVLISIPLWYD